MKIINKTNNTFINDSECFGYSIHQNDFTNIYSVFTKIQLIFEFKEMKIIKF